jgi:Fur family ferric uptake transcriptional regulator
MSIIIDMAEVRRAEEALHGTGLRMTKQRSAIVKALEGKVGFTTAQELFHQLRGRRHAPGLATVYRTLASLASVGALDSAVRDGEQVFRLCGERHHHHLVCESCGRVEEVASEQVESWVRQVARRRGFRVTGHTADVYGICKNCA